MFFIDSIKLLTISLNICLFSSVKILSNKPFTKSIKFAIAFWNFLIFSSEKKFLNISLFKNAINNPSPAALNNALKILPPVFATPFNKPPKNPPSFPSVFFKNLKVALFPIAAPSSLARSFILSLPAPESGSDDGGGDSGGLMFAFFSEPAI